MPRCLWAPHTQTQMHGVRRCRFAPINLGTGPAALLTVRLSACLSRMQPSSGRRCAKRARSETRGCVCGVNAARVTDASQHSACCRGCETSRLPRSPRLCQYHHLPPRESPASHSRCSAPARELYVFIPWPAHRAVAGPRRKRHDTTASLSSCRRGVHHR